MSQKRHLGEQAQCSSSSYPGTRFVPQFHKRQRQIDPADISPYSPQDNSLRYAAFPYTSLDSRPFYTTGSHFPPLDPSDPPYHNMRDPKFREQDDIYDGTGSQLCLLIGTPCSPGRGESAIGMWEDPVVEGESSPRDYQSSFLVKDSKIRGVGILEFPYIPGMGFDDHPIIMSTGKLPQQPFLRGQEQDLSYMSVQDPTMTSPYRTVKAGYQEQANSPTVQSLELNIPALPAKASEAIKTPVIDALPQSKESASKRTLISRPTQRQGEILLEEISISNKKTLGRQGRLSPEKAKKAADMRKAKACLRCRLSKVECSEGFECNRCKSTPALTRPLCIRERLPDYFKLFFPEILNSYLEKEATAKLIQDNIADFSENKIEIHISSGPTYPIIPLLVCEFRPKNEDFLALPQLVRNANDSQACTIVDQYALPLGLSDYALKNLRKNCLDHIKSIVEGPRNSGEWEYGDTSIVSWRVFEAVDRYRRATQKSERTCLLYDAAMLYAMHYFLNEKLLLTNESADKALRGLHSPMLLPYTRDLSPKLITRQVKYEVYMLLQEKTEIVLRGLEEEMRARKKASWANCFCAIMLVCMCAEMVQIATDLKVVHDLRSNQADPNLSRGTGIDACLKLDNKPIWQCIEIFHIAYRSHKKDSNHKLERAFNPLRDEIRIDVKGEIGEPMLNLVREICQINENLDGEIREHMKKPSFDNPDLLASHMAFRRTNSGRLVAKFLRSFWKD